MGEDDVYRDAELFELQTSETLAFFRYDGDLYFANAGYLERQILNTVADKPKLKVLILDLNAIDQIDVTGEEMLAHMSERLQHAGIELFITRPKFKLIDVLQRSGLYDKIGETHFFSKRRNAFAFIKEKYGHEIDMEHLMTHKPVTKKVR